MDAPTKSFNQKEISKKQLKHTSADS